MSERVDIIIRSWNAFEYTLLTLRAIRANSRVPHKITVVDDGSTDETLEKLRAEKDIRLIEHGQNLGVAHSATSGFQNTQSKITVIMDNDVIVPRGWLECLLPYFEDKEVGLVAPLKAHRSYRYPGSQKSSLTVWEQVKGGRIAPQESLREYTRGNSIESFGHKLVRYNRIKDQLIHAPPGFVSGCCLILNRGAVNTAGGIARGVFRLYGGEDVDLCWRLGEHGFKIIKASRAYVHHFGHSSVEASKLAYKEAMKENNMLLYRLWGKKVLSKEKELSGRMSEGEIGERYPFIPLFKNIKLHGRVEVF